MLKNFNEENIINQPIVKKEKIKKIIIVDDNDDVYVINTSSEKSNIVIEKNNSISYYSPCGCGGYDIRLHAYAKEYTIIKNEGKMIMDGIKSFLDDKIEKINNIKKLL